MPEKDASTYSWLVDRRYFLVIVVVVFVLLSVTTFYICYRHHAITTEQALKEDRSTANILSLLLEEHLKKIVSTMESYSSRPLLLRAVRGKSVEKAREHLVSLTKSNPDIDSVIITDRQGTLWAAYPKRPEVLGTNFAYRDWYQEIRKEWKSHVSDAYLRVVAEKDIAVSIGVPLFNETGKTIGILLNVYRTVSLSDLIKQVPLDPGTSITVTDRKGQIVYSSQHDFEKEILLFPFYPSIKKATVANKKTFTVDDPDLGGRTRYISFAPAVDSGWTVFVGRDKLSIFLLEFSYYAQVTAIALLLFLSSILFIVYLRKQVMAQQITEQLQTEKELRASDQRYKSYIDVTMQLGWTTNDKGEIVEDNPSWRKYTGRGYEEFKGFGWIEDIHPDDRDHTEKIWKKAVAEKSFYETEYRIRRYDGVYRDYLARGTPLLDENGSVREWVGTCIDITDRKQADEALINSEKKYRNIFENATEGIFQSTPEGRYISVNPEFARIGGYNSPDEMIDTVTDIQKEMYVHQADRTRLLELINKQDIITNFEAEIRRRDNAIIWISMNVRTIRDEGGKVIFLEGSIVDITERKRIEQALRESEEQFRNLFDNAVEGVFQSTPEGRLISVNMAFSRMFGYESPEEAIKTVADIGHQMYVNPDDRKRAVGIFRETGFIKNFESRMLRKDGSIFWASFNGRLTKTSDGSPCLEGFIIDITDRKQADEALLATDQQLRAMEEQLRASNQRLEAGMKRLADAQAIARLGSWEWDAVKDVITGSDEFYRLFGVGHDQLLTYQAFLDLLHPVDREHVGRDVQESLTKKALYDTEYRVRMPDGDYRYIHARGQVFTDDAGKPVRMAGTCLDITERERAEEALKKSEEKYRGIFENAVEGIYQTTPQGQYISVNPAYVRMLGYESAEELMGSITDIPQHLYVDPSERAELLRLLAEHGSVSGFEIQLYRKDRSIINLAMSARAVKDEKGNFLYLEGTVEDITARKHAEEELRRLNEDLLRSNKELEQFAYVASHDLQEPLRMVSSYTQLLAQRYEGQLDQDAHDFIHYAVDGANRMQRLIQDLLAYSRITTRGSQFVPLDLHEALGEAVANLQTAINESTVMVTNGELPTVNADRMQLVQVFQNLVANAIKFRKKGEPPRIHVWAERAGTEWIISVKDNGIGIDPQYFNRLFTVFQRLHGKQEYPGTGIGLALCRRIVTRHGGRIWVDSLPGEGATFRFTMKA
jgi:PAS domain S-box-containing protein